MKVFIKRYPLSGRTEGVGVVISNNLPLFYFKTLELEYKHNKTRISCIPTGEYKVEKRWSSNHLDHFIVKNVPNRSYILIHVGNFIHETSGCILVGDQLKRDTNKNSSMLKNSRSTLKGLFNLLPSNFQLVVE